MSRSLEELTARIHALHDELEAEYRLARERIAQTKAELAGEFLREQKRYKVGLVRYLVRTRIAVALTAPFIYAGWPVFLLLDLFITVYQAVCFPVYRIPKVRRADFLVFDREDLPYLNVIEKFNCFYCSYGNGILAFAREVAARTEQYWCPIKHARRYRGAHDLYPRFYDHGDAAAYREGLERLRRQYESGRAGEGTVPARSDGDTP